MVRFMSYFAYGATGWTDDGCTYDAISAEAQGLELEHPQRADRHHARAALHHPGSVEEDVVKLSRRTLIKSAGAGLVLAPFYNLLAPRPARAAAGGAKRVFIFHSQPCDTGTGTRPNVTRRVQLHPARDAGGAERDQAARRAGRRPGAQAAAATTTSRRTR